MNYAEALAYLDGYANYEKALPEGTRRPAFGLARLRELAARLGDPQERFPAVHIAGTKGKGSACAFAAAMLQAAGLRVGLYTSPHLVDVRERIQVDGEPIREADFAAHMTRCLPALEKMRVRPAVERRLTYFEVLTHLAFLHFAEQPVDVAVVEVGMGGRLDATNICEPVACGITNISHDHTRILGATLALIAGEKAGIFKRGARGVTAPLPLEAATMVEEVARKVGMPIETVGRELRLAVSTGTAVNGGLPCPRAEVRAADGTWLARAELGLPGAFQAENWAVAARLADLAHRKVRGAPLSPQAIERGARAVRWPGRLEELKQPAATPRLFLDGAHNDHSVRTVLEELRRLLPRDSGRLVVLFACARDKDAVGMLRHVAALSDSVVFTFSGNVRGRDPAELALFWKEVTGREAPHFEDPTRGLAEAQRLAAGAPGRGVVLATGSLYLVGALKALSSAVCARG
jgi:dihydrofolate synthase/folylpolyglutamate synthase